MGKHWHTIVLLLSASFFCNILNAQQAAVPEWCRALPRAAYKNLERVDTKDSWFEVYRIRPGVLAIYEPHQWQEVISYLILGNKRALLFDTGMGIGRISNLVKELTPLPVTVLNSHTHPDHVGGNAEFSDIIGRDLDYTRANASGKPHSEMDEEITGESVCGKLPNFFDPATYVSRPFKIHSYIKESDVIDLGGRKVEVIATPGHTPDSICLIDRANRLLWTGDTFYPGPIYLFAPETDFDSYSRSVEKLATLKKDVDLLLPAHNEPVAVPSLLAKLNAAIQQIQAGHAQFKQSDGKREYSFEGFSILMREPTQTKP